MRIFDKHRFYYLFLFIIIISCSEIAEETADELDAIEQEQETEEEDTNTKDGSTPNILFVIADDMGLDACPGYNIGATKPHMPNLQNLIDNGIRFSNVWSNPTCSPTRASILTGKSGIRNGVVKVMDVLPTSEISLHTFLDTESNSAYSSAVIGKWHLSSSAKHPNDMGIDYYAGSLGGGLPSYTNWSLVINGQTEATSTYATTKVTDLAIDWLGQQTKPWFLWLAYNAPHPPFHLPPIELHQQGALSTNETTIENNPLPYYMAMIEALDTEYGRLINSMSQSEKDNTIIIFMGDNGTPNQVLQGYRNRSGKGTINEGGINVPMIIAGKGVTRVNETEDALINATDLFATIAEIGGGNTGSINDSKSFKSLLTGTTHSNERSYSFKEDGNDDGSIDYTVRNANYKYVEKENGDVGFYNLTNDPLESSNLIGNNANITNAETAIKKELINELMNELKNNL